MARGQALLEFALVIPIVLVLLGVSVDFARLFRSWLDLQALTRDTAEFIASDPTFTADGPGLALAEQEARTRICVGLLGEANCPPLAPDWPADLVVLAPTEAGHLEETKSGFFRATVRATYDFRTIFFHGLFLRADDGWTLEGRSVYEVWRNPEAPT